METIALEADELSVTRSGRPILERVSFRVREGEVFALLGGNGAGKSTTLLTFLGFLEPSAGRVAVRGQSVTPHGAETRRDLAYLPEAATLYPHLSALENLDYLAQLSGQPLLESAADEMLDVVGLAHEARRRPLETYSKGMRQKVAIALALVRNSPILLLDEPTSGLDPIAIDELNALVRSLADGGRTILMVTHDVYGACQVADRLALLHDGAIVGTFARSERGQIDTEAVHKTFAELR